VIIGVDGRPLVTRQIGGAEQHARNVVAQWARMNTPHNFVIFCDKSQQSGTESDRSLLEALPPSPQFRTVYISHYNLALAWTLAGRLLTTLPRALNRYHVDVYHSFTTAVPRTLACPVVQTIHDLAFELDASVRNYPESRAQRRLTRRGASWASRIVAVSSQTKLDVGSLYHVPDARINVVYNGINPAFAPANDPVLQEQIRQRYNLPRSYVLAVGSDIPRRNYGRMFDAMRLLWQVDPQIHLVVAGRADWAVTPLYRRAVDAGMLKRVLFVTAPTDEELAQLYRNAAVTCCASSFEGFGLSVLESMACGTPVACSDMRSLREVADNAAVYFPHDDPETMGQTMLGLIEDVEYRRQLKYRGLARAGLFTWGTAAELILSVLGQATLGPT
jgi:glycosyltransferase involved in cell wall biosynthesis